VPVNQQVGFGFHASGQEFYFQPLGLTEAITIPIHHFSGVGVGQGNPGNGGRPTSQEDRLESVLAPLVAQERSELFPNDPPVDPQLFSQMSAEAQQYYQQILAPLLHDAETDDALAQVALNETTSWGHDISLLGFGLDPPFAGEISTFLTQQAPTILANVYDSAFNRCVNDSSESLRIEEGTKMIAAERDLELFGSEPNPNLSAQLTACMAGPLEMSFDSSMDLIFAPTSRSLSGDSFPRLSRSSASAAGYPNFDVPRHRSARLRLFRRNLHALPSSDRLWYHLPRYTGFGQG
jgi:hypothetical protein